MSIEPLGLCDALDYGAEPLDALDAEFLHSVTALVIGQPQARAGTGIAVGGQGVVGAAGIIPHRLRRPLAQKDGTGVLELVQQLAGRLGLHDQVLRGVGIGDGAGLIQRVAKDHQA